jgi:hypothetical protein
MSKNFLASAAMAALAALAMGLALPASANTLFFRMNPNIDTGGSRSVFVVGLRVRSGRLHWIHHQWRRLFQQFHAGRFRLCGD